MKAHSLNLAIVAFLISGAMANSANADQYTINKWGNRYYMRGPDGTTTMQKFGNRWEVHTPPPLPVLPLPTSPAAPAVPTFQQDPIGTAMRNSPRIIQREPELPMKCRKFGDATICD